MSAKPTTKKFGKSSRDVPAHSEKAQKWYPADDESAPKQVRNRHTRASTLKRCNTHHRASANTSNNHKRNCASHQSPAIATPSSPSSPASPAFPAFPAFPSTPPSPSAKSRHEARSTDYASFLADAEANDHAFRTRMARQRCEQEREWLSSCHQIAANNPPGFSHDLSAIQRDSAYYSSTASRSSTVSGKPHPLHNRAIPCTTKENLAALPQPLPVSPVLTRKPSKTLVRRVSEYFKPPHAQRGHVGIMG